MSYSTTPDYYELLGVARDADTETITKAYRKLARVSHPDSGGNTGMFRLLRVAYETLTDETERKAYDATLEDGAAPRPGTHDDDKTSDFTASMSSADAEPSPQWQFDDGTTRSMIVDPEQLSWWSNVDPDAPVIVDPPYSRGRIPALVALTVYGAIGLAMVTLHLVGAVPLLTGAAVLVASYLRASQGRDVTAVAGVAGAFVVVSTGVYMYVAKPTFATILGFALLLSLGTGTVLLYRLGQMVLLNRLAPSDAVVEQKEYGRPGSGRLAEESDRQFGDRIGADALLPLTFLSGVRVFHGMADPHGGPVIGHAVVCGRLVALVESVYWPSGTYTWTPHGALLRDGNHFADGDLGFDTTVAGYRQVLGDRVDVRGFVLVAAPDRGAVVGGVGPTGVLLGEPQTVIDELGAWFLQHGAANRVDRHMLVSLYRHRAEAVGAP